MLGQGPLWNMQSRGTPVTGIGTTKLENLQLLNLNPACPNPKTKFHKCPHFSVPFL